VLHKFVTYSPTKTLTNLLTAPDPHGAPEWHKDKNLNDISQQTVDYEVSQRPAL